MLTDDFQSNPLRPDPSKRRRYDANFKAKVALAALTSKKTLPELSEIYGVNESIISQWKWSLIKNAEKAFEKSHRNKSLK